MTYVLLDDDGEGLESQGGESQATSQAPPSFQALAPPERQFSTGGSANLLAPFMLQVGSMQINRNPCVYDHFVKLVDLF